MYPALKNKVALVTGASRGFGKAIALRLAKEGCNIVLNYRRSKTEAEDTAAEIEALGVKVLLVRADMGKEDKITDMFETIKSEWNQCDIVVANASFGIPGKMMDATSRYWDMTMDSTAKSLLLLAQGARPFMKKGGHIVSVTSYGGQRVLDDYGVVGPAKGTVESLTRSLAVELGKENIIVNGIMPGLCNTKSFQAIPGADEALEMGRQRTPAGRLVTPEDAANVVAFLCSGQADMIGGQLIVIDGGAFIVG